MKIGLLDPALYSVDGSGSPNIGDQIISRAVRRELRGIFGESVDFVAVSSHRYPSIGALKSLQEAEHVFVGGSNLLYFRWWRPALWKIGPLGLLGYRNLVLMGVGWGAYDIRANSYGKWLCDLILSGSHLHSVRDSYTRSIAERELGIPRVANTACPTMWRLDDALLSSIHRRRGDRCVFALTDYAKDPQADTQLINDLRYVYGERLVFWPQGRGDLLYCRSLGYSGAVMERSLSSLLDALSSGDRLDYVGTRLHAGVLCLEHRVRSLIVSVDNRAREIAVDTGLPAIERNDRAALRAWFEESPRVHIHLPTMNIEAWKEQFRASSSPVPRDARTSATVAL
jgi:hypothetical protein